MTFWKAWEWYWFRPAPLFDLGVVRLIAVGFQLSHLANLRPRAVYGQLAALPDFMYEPLLVLRVMVLPFGWRYRPSEDLIVGAYWLTLAVGVFAFVGYRTRLSLSLFAAGNIFLQAFEYSFLEVHHAEAIVMITLALLALAPAGGALAVDDLLRRLRDADRESRAPAGLLSEESRFVRWPLLLVQWMFALIYLSAGFHKLTSGGLDWMNGWTLQYYMVQDAMRWGSDAAGTGAGYAPEPGVGLWIGQSHTMATIASWASVLFETTFWVVLVIPRLALVFLPIGFGFHLAVYFIQRVGFFSFMSLYAVFVPWRDVFRRTGAWLVSRTSPVVVGYDPASPRSVRRAALIRYFDWFGLVVLVPGPPSAESIAAVRTP